MTIEFSSDEQAYLEGTFAGYTIDETVSIDDAIPGEIDDLELLLPWGRRAYAMIDRADNTIVIYRVDDMYVPEASRMPKHWIIAAYSESTNQRLRKHDSRIDLVTDEAQAQILAEDYANELNNDSSMVDDWVASIELWDPEQQ